MSAARLDPFSARLHAIRIRNAKAAPKPASPRLASPLLNESAPEGATGTHASVSRTAVPEPSDDEPPGAGNFATPVLRDEHIGGGDDHPDGILQLSRLDEAQNDDDDDFADHRPPSGHREARPRSRAQDEEREDEIRDLRKRVEELERVVKKNKSYIEHIYKSFNGSTRAWDHQGDDQPWW